MAVFRDVWVNSVLKREEITGDDLVEYNNRVNNANSFENAIAFLRQRRNMLLAETDFYALSDVTMSDDMKKYRQDLRDLTDGLTTKSDVDAVTYPTKPE
tara:strand:- start:59 stop:355 length:297 start_codon:yes stop_codon:yes gene_type:complete